MGAIYIGIILLCRVAQHLCNKQTSNRITTPSLLLKYCTFRNLLSAVLGLAVIIIAGNGFNCDLTTVLISIFSGLMLTASTWLGLAVLKNGTVALSSMFGTAGLLIPCIAGIFLFDEPMSLGQWCGIMLFFVAAYLLISSSKEIYKGFSLKTFLLLLGVMLSEGFTMLSQQLFANLKPDGDVTVFSFLSFGTLGVIMLVVSFFTPSAPDTDGNGRLTPTVLALGTVLSVAVFLINQFATKAAAVVQPVVLFTFINGGSTIIGSIVAAVFFKEKLTPKSILGIILGVGALIIIKAL